MSKHDSILTVERALLCPLIRGKSEALAAVGEVTRAHFSDVRHMVLFSAALDVWKRHGACTPDLLKAHLQNTGEWAHAEGDSGYLATVLTENPSLRNAKWYADRLRAIAKQQRRECLGGAMP